MAGCWVQILAVMLISSKHSFGYSSFEEAGGSSQKDLQFKYSLQHDEPRDTVPREIVDGSYSVVQTANSQGIHEDKRFQINYEPQLDRAPIFQQESREEVNNHKNQASSPMMEQAKTNVHYPTHQTSIIGHQLLGDQHTLQELLRRNQPESGEHINNEKEEVVKESISQGESTASPTVSPSLGTKKQDIKKATILPVLLKPFYTILQPETKREIPRVPALLNTQTNLGTFQIPPSFFNTKRSQNGKTSLSPAHTIQGHTSEQINCDPITVARDETSARITNGAGKSLSMSRHQPTAAKSYELAPSALPLVGGLPHDSAHLQILSENPHHIFIHPPKVFPVTPSPEQSGPLLGGPPHKPRTTTTRTPLSSTTRTNNGNNHPINGRSLFFDSKPEQNLQTLQQQMYPTRARLEPLANVQPVQQYVWQQRPASKFTMQYPIAQQSNQEQLFLMMQRRYIQNNNNQDMLTYMQPVAVLVMPSNPKTKQN